MVLEFSVGWLLVDLHVPRTLSAPLVRLGENQEDVEVKLEVVFDEIELFHICCSLKDESREETFCCFLE